MGKSLIVDGMSVLKTTAGGQAFLTNGYSFSFFQQLTAVVKKFRPEGIFVLWEGGHDHRAAILPGYKSTRKQSPSVVRTCRDIVQMLLPHLGVYQARAPGFEADDLAGWMISEMPRDSILVTNDRDWLQLIRRVPEISVYIKPQNDVNRKPKRDLVDMLNFEESFGFPDPDTFLRCKIACGDKSDEIPSGVPGIGENTVRAWLLGMEIQPAKATRLEEFFAGSEAYHRNASLVDIRTPHPGIRPEWTPGKLDRMKALGLLNEIGFASIVSKFEEWFSHYEGAALDRDSSQ